MIRLKCPVVDLEFLCPSCKKSLEFEEAERGIDVAVDNYECGHCQAVFNVRAHLYYDVEAQVDGGQWVYCAPDQRVKNEEGTEGE